MFVARYSIGGIMRNYITREDIIKAFENNEFKVYIQPRYNIYTKEVIGGEALVRWFHGKKGMLSSGLCIQVLEKLGLIEKLDLFIFEEECKNLASWEKQGLKRIPISVNLSQMTLKDMKNTMHLRDLLHRHEVPIELIELELTETFMCMNNEGINKLREEGFKILMDDFGKGYSSLASLKELPVDVIKIDRDFLIDIEKSEKAQAILKTIIDLMEIIKKEVVIEGIETKQQLEFIKSTKCKFAQGFLFNEAMSLEDFKQLIL